MTKQEHFIALYYPYAFMVQSHTGLAADIILTQAALESSWGKKAIGNNFFGIKANPKMHIDKKQLFTTTEILKTNDVKFPEIINITKLENGQFKYLVKDWFRKYATPAESFADYASLFQRLSRYKAAWEVRGNAEQFFIAIHKAGYATAPNYATVLINMNVTIKELIEDFISIFSLQ